MRALLVLIPLSLCSAPALAQAAAPAAPPPEAVVSPVFMDSATADRLADAAQSLSKVVLDLKVGGVEAALQGRQPTRAQRNLTVRDLARRDDPNFDRHLDQEIAAARPKIEQGVRAMNQALPEIQRSLADAQKSIERAMANMPDPNYPRR